MSTFQQSDHNLRVVLTQNVHIFKYNVRKLGLQVCGFSHVWLWTKITIANLVCSVHLWLYFTWAAETHEFPLTGISIYSKLYSYEMKQFFYRFWILAYIKLCVQDAKFYRPLKRDNFPVFLLYIQRQIIWAV